ncbi:Muramoyltetrapeptide carboxypeptidase LdcA (peptidoglycan recycling) [Cohnella sp. OV330]|uniref:S66 family peptidase n=1 Tax=Cohnella sp. OV330 TaxID=1855288 RepID=UPI0008DEC5C8|nr:S66 peptidase family protein [Cohnella sp. OV330]SFA78613.1 Muramoyltetrapeptide carboxypeptidase LdcA (peptidoglycan recycling) [Cohnella sp. OV330]
MIVYPKLPQQATIGVTAPSSGVSEERHSFIRQAVARFERQGYQVAVGETTWTQHKAKSAPARVRAAELNAFLQDGRTDLVMPPWGGELLIEVLEHLDFDRIAPKWIMGYSDISVLLLAVTLRTGMATAHGTNFVDLRGEWTDPTTAAWEQVLWTGEGESVAQTSSTHHQDSWSEAAPAQGVYHLTEPTVWKIVGGERMKASGRLLGGCIDVIRHLIGTPYGDVRAFRERHIPGEPVLWYLENCELATVDMRRSLVQMKLAGWFENCAGILFGRSGVHIPREGYTELDMFEEIADELGLPVAYDIDCGHKPPQLTLVNGAYAEVVVEAGRGTVVQTFMP